MKFKRLAGLALLLPIALFGACSNVSPLTINANWYRDTTIRDEISATYERLEYAVTFTQNDVALKLDYANATYFVELKNETLSVNGANMSLYRLHTEFSADVTFTLDGKHAGPFADSIVTDVWFHNVNEGLTPVKSTRTVVSTTPMSDRPENLQENTIENPNGAYRIYEYTTMTEYDANMETAKVVYDETHPEPERRDAERTLELNVKGSYLDNEQIAFALRGLDMSATDGKAADCRSERG